MGHWTAVLNETRPQQLLAERLRVVASNSVLLLQRGNSEHSSVLEPFGHRDGAWTQRVETDRESDRETGSEGGRGERLRDRQKETDVEMKR